MLLISFYFLLYISINYSFMMNDNIVKYDVPNLPEKIIVGYANWNQCDESILEAVKNGVNVVIWFAINLSTHLTTGKPLITNGPNWNDVAKMINTIKELNLETIHLISIGGWNSPHPDTVNSVVDVYNEFNKWNRQKISNKELNFKGFDGFDWDIEGNDDMNSKYNTFTVECINLMGEFSQLAKKDGYIVAMAPAESYLDPTTSEFDRKLSHLYSEWLILQPNFAYHGHNVYAYLLSRYGKTDVNDRDDDDNDNCNVIDTFDFITVQLYEGYSHAEYNINVMKVPPEIYLMNLVKMFNDGWNINFSNDISIDWNDQYISVPHTKLVIGLGNGWAGDDKFLLIYPEDISKSYNLLKENQLDPKGFAFWNIKDEGISSFRNVDKPVYMAIGLNEILHIR